ncbi:MAG: FAD-dependent oxidoreductase [Bryobacteraceae bacterium]
MRLVVIGGVAAGMSAAARARRIDPALEITVLEKSDRVSWAACGLPYWVDGRAREADLVVHDADYFRRERKIDVRTGANVEAIEHARRVVRLAAGETVRYDRLVIATGARANTSSIAGADRAGVFKLHTMEDGAALRGHLESRPPTRAMVIGGGYIALEAAEALRARGQSVKIVTASNHLLGREDAWLTQQLVRHLERFRVTVEFGRRLNAIPEDWPLVVIAAGLRPNVGLAQAAGVECGRTGAIRVNDRLETNLGSVWAAGDCVEVQHLVSGRPVWMPLGTTANKTGRVAGACAAGKRERFSGIVGTSIVRVCGLGVGLTGFGEAEARREGFDPVAVRIDAPGRPRYFRGRPVSVELVADRRSGRLVGAAVLGDEAVAGRIGVVATALTARMTVEDFAQLDLPYAPPFATVWDPLLIAGQQLQKELTR